MKLLWSKFLNSVIKKQNERVSAWEETFRVWGERGNSYNTETTGGQDLLWLLFRADVAKIVTL